MTGSLHDIVRGCEQRGAAEGEYDRVGVQRSQATVGQKWQIEIQLRPDELRGDEDARQHPYNAPDDGHDRKLANDPSLY